MTDMTSMTGAHATAFEPRRTGEAVTYLRPESRSSRRAWLVRTEADLRARVDARAKTLESGAQLGDPLLQRLNGALSRVRRELAEDRAPGDP